MRQFFGIGFAALMVIPAVACKSTNHASAVKDDVERAPTQGGATGGTCQGYINSTLSEYSGPYKISFNLQGVGTIITAPGSDGNTVNCVSTGNGSVITCTEATDSAAQYVFAIDARAGGNGATVYVFDSSISATTILNAGFPLTCSPGQSDPNSQSNHNTSHVLFAPMHDPGAEAAPIAHKVVDNSSINTVDIGGSANGPSNVNPAHALDSIRYCHLKQGPNGGGQETNNTILFDKGMMHSYMGFDGPTSQNTYSVNGTSLTITWANKPDQPEILTISSDWKRIQFPGLASTYERCQSN